MRKLISEGEFLFNTKETLLFVVEEKKKKPPQPLFSETFKNKAFSEEKPENVSPTYIHHKQPKEMFPPEGSDNKNEIWLQRGKGDVTAQCRVRLETLQLVTFSNHTVA